MYSLCGVSNELSEFYANIWHYVCVFTVDIPFSGFNASYEISTAELKENMNVIKQANGRYLSSIHLNSCQRGKYFEFSQEIVRFIDSHPHMFVSTGFNGNVDPYLYGDEYQIARDHVVNTGNPDYLADVSYRVDDYGDSFSTSLFYVKADSVSSLFEQLENGYLHYFEGASYNFGCTQEGLWVFAIEKI